MLATVKKKPKKAKPNVAPQLEQKPPSEPVQEKKEKKLVRVKSEKKAKKLPKVATNLAVKPEVKLKKVPTGAPHAAVKPGKPEVKPKKKTVSIAGREAPIEDKSLVNGKTDKRKLEPKVPLDARVIDVVYEEDVPTPETIEVEPKKDRDERINYLTGKGTQHPVHELIQNLRNILLNSGFNELENSFFVADTDIKKQHEVNPNLVFDKVYYLAESQRPVIELNQEQSEQLKQIIPTLNIEKLNEILNEYKNNNIENYQIFQQSMTELNLTYDQITKMLDIIPGLNETNPKLTNITLRSTMASSWFQTLAAVMDKENMPIKLFSTGIWFKRGPKLDELKLSSHYGASLVIMDDKISVTNGKVIAEEILNRLGFKELEFKDSHQSQNFNVTTDEVGIFINGIQITTYGMFSKEVLHDYGIDIPTLYINFGLEHLVMVQKGFDDIRELMFPQFYKAWKLNDAQIAEALKFIHKPKTDLGKTIANNLVKVCEEHGKTISPCEYIVWEGAVNINQLKTGTEPQASASTSPSSTLATAQRSSNESPSTQIMGDKKRLMIKVFKHEKDSKLCGPAYLNEIVVKDGEIYGVQNNDDNQDLSDVQHTKIRYLDAFSKLVANTIERKLETGHLRDTLEINIGIIKEMEDINLQLDGAALRYLLTNNKKIDVRGPMFINVEYKLINSQPKK